MSHAKHRICCSLNSKSTPKISLITMTGPLNCLITLTVLIAIASIIDAIGFPSGGGGGCGCGGGGHSGVGGGGGGGCGRKKREIGAVQPYYMGEETPCPQLSWKQILDESIHANDTIGSVSAIQTALYSRFADQQLKFLVTCSSADEAPKNGTAVTNIVHFSSSGDGYCSLVKEHIWCQAVALST